jgi:hypothetical protein
MCKSLLGIQKFSVLNMAIFLNAADDVARYFPEQWLNGGRVKWQTISKRWASDSL